MTLSEPDLRLLVERGVTAKLPASPRVLRVSCRPSESAGWYASYRVQAELADGKVLELFLKDYDSFRARKHDMVGRRERERQVYRDLLSSGRHGTAEYFGSAWDDGLSRHWLLLEYVTGTPLGYLDFHHWLRAAAWLASLQAHFEGRRDRLIGCPHLVRHGKRLYLRTAERAVAAVTERSGTSGSGITDLLHGYDRLVERMIDQPPTLVHGAYLPMQILVSSANGDPRLCPVDWELAAIGSPAYDLAFLVDGFDEPQRKDLLEAYADRAASHGLSLPSDLDRLVLYFSVHKTLTSLGHSLEREYDEGSVNEYLMILEKLFERVGALDRV